MKQGLTRHCSGFSCYPRDLEPTGPNMCTQCELGLYAVAVFSRLWLHVFSLSVNVAQCTRICTHGLARISSDACHGKYSAEQSLACALYHVR